MPPRLLVPALMAAVVLQPPPVSGKSDAVATIAGGVATYVVARDDTLVAIAARFGVYPSTIAFDNQLDLKGKLETGRVLRIDNRHIVPFLASGEIVVNVPQRMVFLRDGVRVFAYPAAVWRATWQTPIAAFTIIRKEEDPAWHVPASIRAESAARGRVLPHVVPAGPRNPLGQFWIGLSVGSVGIHGTPQPNTIYQAATHGCIRLQRDHIAELYSLVEVGTAGHIVYEPILFASDDEDIYIEVHRDVYRR